MQSNNLNVSQISVTFILLVKYPQLSRNMTNVRDPIELGTRICPVITIHTTSPKSTNSQKSFDDSNEMPEATLLQMHSTMTEDITTTTTTTTKMDAQNSIHAPSVADK